MKRSLQYTGVVTDGRFSAMDSLLRALAGMTGGRVRITVEEVKRRRRLNQNAFYHGVIVVAVREMFADCGTDLDEEQVHAYLKEHVGGLKSVATDPAGVRRTVVGSTARLSTMDFEDYLDRIRAWPRSSAMPFHSRGRIVSLKDIIAIFPPPYYIRRARVPLERLKRHRCAPFAIPTLQEVQDALESLDALERQWNEKPTKPERT